MLFFAHTGLTTGLAMLLERAANKPVPVFKARTPLPAKTCFPTTTSEQGCSTSGNSTTKSTSLLKLDYRLVLVGSLLPDIIDKPLGLIILRSSLGNSRIIGHTLLLTLLLVALGYLLRKKYNSRAVLTLASGSFVHILLDEMWLRPETLFWPVFGFDFPPDNPSGWLVRILLYGLTHPGVYVPEIAGAIILILFCFRVVKKAGIRNFLKRGSLP